MLTIEDLFQYHGESLTLQGISLEIPKSSCIAIIGNNGAGKTSLLRTIVGSLVAKSGKVILDDEELADLPAHQRIRRGIGYVCQGRGIFSHLTVQENLLTGLAGSNYPKAKLPAEVYDLFPILKDLQNKRGGNLSGGQQQQLAIARALVHQPKLLLLDEVTEGLQPNLVEKVYEVIQQLNREQSMTILITTPQIKAARAVSDHFHVMQKGKLVADGPTKELKVEEISNYLLL